jgi:tRNA(fMet)-specific endonuclease VapC
MTTEYLLDTNVCIAIRDLLTGKPGKQGQQEKLDRVKARWSKVDKAHVAMSTVTLGELRFGVEKSRNVVEAERRLALLEAAVQTLDLDGPTSRHYGVLRHALEASGRKIGPNDTWIAAHGLRTGRTVVTNNLGEFQRVHGLTVEDWTA